MAFHLSTYELKLISKRPVISTFVLQLNANAGLFAERAFAYDYKGLTD